MMVVTSIESHFGRKIPSPTYPNTNPINPNQTFDTASIERTKGKNRPAA
jgi:hypothetical protein